MKKILLTVFLFPLAAYLLAQENNYVDIISQTEKSGDFAPMFPFQPSHDAPQNITNVKTWKGSTNAPAGADGFICAKGDRFVDGNGRKIRFLGTNICFSGCFPSHGDADRVAAELARYGINVVRLHYVHHSYPPGKNYPETDSFIEPEQLERFDYLFAKLKEQGIYTYFQLNIARKFSEQNGFENASKLPFYNNGVDNFDGKMIELQKRFHNEILNHRNKYTGLKYKDEPAISMLELSNENSIMYTWFSPKHRMPNLVEPYATDLKDMWNDFLRTKYGDDSTLRRAWLVGLNGDGSELISDGIMSGEGTPEWGLQNDGVSDGNITFVQADSRDKIQGEYYCSIKVDKIGATPNMPQFFRNGLKFKSMEPLCLRMKMRSDRMCQVAVRFSQAHAPWSVAGMNSTVEVGKKWKEYEFNFTSNMDDDNVRLILSHFTPCIIDVADVSLTRGMSYTWPKDESLKNNSVRWPGKNDWSLLPQRAIDFTEFMGVIETTYFRHLRSTLKSYIHSNQPVTGTQLHYGLDLPQAEMDYCDYHCYWNHPTFKVGQWDANNWYMRKLALVNGDGFPGSSLATAARSRILGKPFTVSEYDHPNLYPFAAEGNLMASAFGAFQNWSGIIQFAWTHNTDFFRDMENPMFDMCSSTQKLVHFPACYSMFVRGDVSMANQDIMYVMEATMAEEISTIARNQNTVSPAWERNNMLASLPLAIASGRVIPEYPKLFNKAGRTIVKSASDIPDNLRKAFEKREIVSCTGEITWNWQVEGAGYFMVDTPNTKVFSGYVRGRSFDYKGMTLTPGKSRFDWLTLSLTNTAPSDVCSDKTLAPGKYLLAATGLVHNTGARIMDVGAGQLTFSEQVGGAKGTGPVLCEGIDAVITFPSLGGRVCCKALDCEGNPIQIVPVTVSGDGSAVIHISPEFKTVWYEIDVAE